MAGATPIAGGLLLLDKPAGISSNHALGRAKRILGIRKAGHAGTLDPFATGMLLCAFGQATKVNAYLLGADKTYSATLKLGQSTTTGDIEGEITDTSEIPLLSLSEWQALANKLTGELEQIPPMYSALKHQGQPLYKLARQGKTVDRKARRITIHMLKVTSWDPPLLSFEVRCSKGTYVRTLGEQLAGIADTVGHLSSLRRTSIDAFVAGQMVGMEQLESADQPLDYLLSADQGLLGYPVVNLNASQWLRFVQGQQVADLPKCVPGLYRVYRVDNLFLGIGEVLPETGLKPRRVFHVS